MKKQGFLYMILSIVLSLSLGLSICFTGIPVLAQAVDEYGGIKLNNNKDVSKTTVWNDTDAVYNETVMFYENRETAKLLYPIDQVVSVRSYDLQTVYEEGTDYRVTEDGWLQWISGGNMPKYEQDFSKLDLFRGASDVTLINAMPKIQFDNQVCVTYTHSKTWEDGFSGEKPEAKLSTDNEFYKKLTANSGEVNAVFFGDSISVGYNASGLNQETRAWDSNKNAFVTATATMKRGSAAVWYGEDFDPEQDWTCPSWAKQVNAYLESMSGGATVNYHNVSIAGKTSQWGSNSVKDQLRNPENTEEYISPDILFVGFGMNDTCKKADYKTNIQNIISNVKSINPDCLIVLVSAFNPNHNHSMLKYYEEANNELSSNDQNIISVPVYTVFTDVKKSKPAADYTSNGFNHVNDFGVRLYAKIIEATLTPVEAVEHTPSQVEVSGTWNENWGTLVTENGSAAEVAWNGTSLISGQVPAIYHKSAKIPDKTTRPWSANCPSGGAGMTDGNLRNGNTENPGWYQFSIGNSSFGLTTTEPTGTYPWIFVFDLGGTYKISQTTLITTSTVWQRLYKYGFYVGNSESDVVENMRNASNPVYTIDNGNSGEFHHYSANDDEVTGRYVGIAVTDLNEINNGTSGANILSVLEFAVFGEKVSDESGFVPQVKQMTFTQSAALDSNFGTEATVNTSVTWKRPSIIQGLVPVCTNYKDGTVPAEKLTYDYKTGGQPVHNGSATGMTDGSTKPGTPDYGWFQIAGNSTPGETEPVYPWRFTFELDGEYKIDSAALLTHATNLGGMLNNYKIYVSDELNTLYDGTPVAIAIADTSVANGCHHFSIDKEDAFLGKYIGLEIWDFNMSTTTGLPGSLIIREFAVFGEKLSDTNLDLSASEKAGSDDSVLTLPSAENPLQVKVNTATLVALKRDTNRYAYLEADRKYAINISYSVTDISGESTISLVYNDSSDDYDTLRGHNNGSIVLASNKNNQAGDYTISAMVLGIDKKPLRLAFTGNATFDIKSVNIVSASDASTDTYAVKFYDQRTSVNEAKLLKKDTADFQVPNRTAELNFAGWFNGTNKVTSINDDMKLIAKWCSKYDSTADDEVDIRDLVRLKKSIADITEDLFYDINRDDSINSKDLTELRKALLSGENFTVDNILFEEGISYDRAIVTVKTSSVINEDFEGIGVNSIPVSLMENNLDQGNNAAYFELEKSRIIKLKPAIARLWTQVDWFVTENDFVSNGGNGEDYYAGTYDFESNRMQALYQYLDAFKQAGSKVILVTNWKVGPEIQQWFSISGLSTPETSAPKDIPAYARAYTELLKYLINTKGYTNIAYVSVANEPDLSDFQTLTGDYGYYQETSKALADEIKSANLNVSLQGIDCGSSSFTSTDFLYRSFIDNPEYFNDYALHSYQTISEAKQYLSTVKNNLPIGKSIWLTEFNGGADFAASRSGFMGLAANLGYKSALYWMLNDVYGESPLDFSKICGGSTGLWNAPQKDATVKDSFYEFALWSRYVLPHSQVIESAVNNESDIRSTAFKNGEDYTVIVETNINSATSLTIDFDKKINKKFFKHVYIVNSRGNNSEANGIIPVSEADFDVKASLVDMSVINQKRVVIVYTTIPDITQVNLDKVVVKVNNGETAQLVANATNGAELTWSVVSGAGSIDQTGNYTADGTQAGDIVAVKAAVDDNTYAIAIVMIQ